MGEIDRIDQYGDFARVIDYKTGSVEFSYSDLYYGKKIQLMIYMRILINNGYRPAGFFYFPFAVAWRDNDYSHRLTGAFNTDFEVVTAFDRSIEQGGKSKVFECEVKINDKGAISFGRNAKAKSEDDLFALTQYAERVAEKAIEDINEGRIAPCPSATSASSSCSYCEYKSVCPRTCERELGSISADEVIEAVKK
jgi:ATP-dependent helicase/nuclease subunit B